MSLLLSFSRRVLLGSTATICLSIVGKPSSLFGFTANSATGRINLGLNGISVSSLFYPFLNVWKCAGAIQIAAGSTNYWSNIAPGSPNSAWDGFLNSEGELAKPLRPTVTSMYRIFYAPPPDGAPASYNRIGERWVLKWMEWRAM